MHFKTIADFLHMGGYASFVWPAYGLVFFVLSWIVVSAIRQKNKIVYHLQSNIKQTSEINALPLLEK